MPKVVDHEERRLQIAHGLWQVISERGIEGVTYQRVAEAAKVSVGRIQHYFDSKEELVLAGCQAMVDQAEARYNSDADDPWDALFELLSEPIPQSAQFRLGAAVWYAYMARGVVDPAIGEIVGEATRGTVEEAKQLLTDAHIPHTIAPRLATRLVSLSNGLTQRVLIGATPAYEALGLITEEIGVLRESYGE